jgi:hypothetical protein
VEGGGSKEVRRSTYRWLGEPVSKKGIDRGEGLVRSPIQPKP